MYVVGRLEKKNSLCRKENVICDNEMKFMVLTNDVICYDFISTWQKQLFN